jgi:uncharacterized protein involved in exopolysaccharide biosynthesis
MTSAQGVRLGLIWLVIAMLGAAAGLALTKSQTTLYAARVEIQYNVSVQDASDHLKTDRDLTTQTVLLTSRSVLGPAAQASGVSADDLEADTTATIVLDSAIIQVDVLNADRDAGVKQAAAIGDQYLKVVEADSPTVYIQGQIDQAKQQLTTASPPDAALLQSRITTLQGQLDIEHIAGTQASIVVPAFSVTDPAYPNPLLAAGTGTLCGIVIACLVAIGVARRWTRG